MAIASRASCNLVIGARNLDELGRFGVDESEADPALFTTDRIAAALSQADSWIQSFFPIGFDAAAHAILVRWASEQTIYFLEDSTENGASDSARQRLSVRETLLFQMAKREVYVDGGPTGRGVTTTVAIRSESRFSPQQLANW